ncbi:MAG: hypothetical protein ACLRWH_03120 [Emergencia sp.]
MKTFESNTTEYNDSEVLKYLIQSGNINLDDVANEMRKSELNKILEQHPYKIAQTGKDKRWRTYVKLENGKRHLIAKSTLEDVHQELYEHYKNLKPAPSVKVHTLETLFPIWKNYKALHGASTTYLRRIDSDWGSYYEGTDIIKIPITELNKLTLDIWAHELIQKTNNSKKQYYNVSVIMRQALDYAVDAEMILNNPLRKVKVESRMVFNPVRKKASETQVFTRKEVSDLYDYAWEDFEKGRCNVHKLAPLAVMFQFQTGVRIGELFFVMMILRIAKSMFRECIVMTKKRL